MNCPICNSSLIDILKEFPQSITSDSKMIDKSVSIVICTDCGNLFNSQGARNNISNFYQNSYDLLGSSFQAETRIFGDKKSFSISDWRLKHLQSLNILPNIGNVLDIGCGKGNFLQKFNSLFPDWNLYGIESSKSSLSIAKNNLSNSIFHERIYNKNLFDHKFDLIVALNVLEHIEEPKLFLENIFNDLTENGLVCFDIPNFKVNPIDVYVYDHLTHFTSETLVNLLQNIGFKILKLVENTNQVPILVICTKNLKKLPLKNFYNMTKRLVDDSLIYNEELFSTYNFVNKTYEQFGVVGLGIPVWKGIQNRILDSSKIFSFYDENQTIIGSKYDGILVKSLDEISHEKSLPLIYSVSPCYIDNLKQKIYSYGNKQFLPKSYSYFLKYF